MFVCVFVCLVGWLFVWLFVWLFGCLVVCLVDGFRAAEVFFFGRLFVYSFVLSLEIRRATFFVCLCKSRRGVCSFVFLFLRSFVYDPPSCSVPFFLCFRREFLPMPA